ncbi:hypothetical protein StrepF001_18655 [Streptomyces sp. F001]|nr:hypothetical protein StrepF001_18655 [Streptomyces sp. F001]
MSRVRENRTHGSMRRGLETERTYSATAPAPDPTPDPLILIRSRDSRTAVLHASRCRATSREGTAAGEESRR